MARKRWIVPHRVVVSEHRVVEEHHASDSSSSTTNKLPGDSGSRCGGECGGGEEEHPVFYHCISRVVDRRLAFGPDEKEKFRSIMRGMERFSGCRIVAYCLMCNHIHLLVEVPPPDRAALTDEQLLDRLRAIYNEAFVADVASELADARQKIAAGLGGPVLANRIHERFTYRMHNLSEFMKTVMQRFTQWFNRTHDRTGNLWEDAFRSVIVEDGAAARTVAAYIDLNPVRAGMVSRPEQYHWSSYGEAIGGGPRGNGRRARAGLVRALRAHRGAPADASQWPREVGPEYHRILLAGAGIQAARQGTASRSAKTESVPARGALGRRVRYFTDGAVIGSREFVNRMFAGSKERFGPARRDGARKMRDPASANNSLWSMRDLRKGVAT